MTDGDDRGGDTGDDVRRRSADTAETDPRRVRAIAVHAEDVVAALETNRRGSADGQAVLRVTPPFSGRMRARIHVDRGVDDDPVAVAPERLVADPPPLPTPDDVADELRADPNVEYTRKRHRDRYETALEEWRATVADRIVDRVRLVETHAVDVVVIGAA